MWAGDRNSCSQWVVGGVFLWFLSAPVDLGRQLGDGDGRYLLGGDLEHQLPLHLQDACAQLTITDQQRSKNPSSTVPGQGTPGFPGPI